jgi:peptide/nickel transport system permease protein
MASDPTIGALPGTIDGDPALALAHAGDRGPRGRRAHVLRQLRTSPGFLVGSVIVLFWVAMALGWRWLTPHSPFTPDTLHTLASPSSSHWLGTDDLGRDVLSRTLAGAAPVLSIAPLATAIAIVAGTLIGLSAGYYRGVVDELLMRSVDVLLALPSLIVAVLVLGLVGTSNLNVILLIAIFFSPLVARTVRSAVLAEREREYVGAARMRGEGGWYTMIVEILPNVTAPILVEATVRLGYAVFTAATLSFLGLGVQPPSPDWGRSISDERLYVQVQGFAVIAPAIALATLVVGVNLVADGLTRALRD